MAKQFPALDDTLTAFIARQHIFFAASATADSRINISPREASAFRVMGPNAVCWLDQTGSGAETAAHMLADGRLTVLFCSFEQQPMILRLFGRGRSLARSTPGYDAMLAGAFAGEEAPGARQIVQMDIDLVQTSCGYGVPFFDFVSERTQLKTWAGALGAEGVAGYRARKNVVSIDGLPTGLLAEAAE